MVKKVFTTLLLAAVLVIAGGVKAEAAEVYVGSYSDGTSVYLLTHTVYHPNSGRYMCTVRAGRDYLDYTFMLTAARGWMYENSEGYSGKVYGGSSPVAANICNYLRNNY